MPRFAHFQVAGARTTASGPLEVTVPVTRINDGWLASAERRALAWFAVRLPARVNSDHLTALALASMIGAGVSYWLVSRTPAGLVLATVCLAANWFGDSLDGTVARLREQERPRYGYYVDHVADAVGIAALVGGLAASGLMHPATAAALLLAYYLVCIEVYLAAHSLGRFQMSVFRMGPTELRLLLALGNVTLLLNPDAGLMGGRWRLLDAGGVVGAAGLALAFVVSAATNGRRLYREEPMPARAAPGPAHAAPATRSAL